MSNGDSDGGGCQMIVAMLGVPGNSGRWWWGVLSCLAVEMSSSSSGGGEDL